MEIIQFFIFLTILVIIFLIIRDIVLWYWRINERARLLQAQNEHLKKIYDLLLTIQQNQLSQKQSELNNDDNR